MALDAAASITSDSAMPPTPVWMTLTATSSLLIFCSSETAASTEPCTSPLMMRASSLTAPSPIWRKRSSSDTRLLPLHQALHAQPLGALLRHPASLALGLDDARQLAGGRRMVEAEDLDRDRRAGLRDAVAVLVEHRAHLAPGVAGDDGVARLERAALHEHRRHRAAAHVEARLDDRPRGRRVRVGLQLQHVGLQQQQLEQRVEPLALLRATR